MDIEHIPSAEDFPIDKVISRWLDQIRATVASQQVKTLPTNEVEIEIPVNQTRPKVEIEDDNSTGGMYQFQHRYNYHL